MINLKQSARTLLKSPFVSGVAILSLALGIGANAAIFSLVDRVLLQPLPYHEPDRLVAIAAVEAARRRPGRSAARLNGHRTV